MDQSRIVRIKLCEIDLTAGTQTRAGIDQATVEHYAADMLEATQKFPPVVVYQVQSQFILVDGFHRLAAVNRNGFNEIQAEVRIGTKADALKFALSANISHGLRRTNADKNRSVELALDEWPDLSSAEIARVCAVSHTFVEEIRRRLQPATDAGSRTGADGKKRKLPVRQIDASRTSTATAPVVNEESAPKESALLQESPLGQGYHPASKSSEFDHTIGISTAIQFFSSQVEDVSQAILEDASDSQLEDAIRQWDIEGKRLRAEQRRRREAPGKPTNTQSAEDLQLTDVQSNSHRIIK